MQHSRHITALAFSTAVAVLLCGCSEHESPSDYLAFSGTIRGLDAETGELFVRADERVRGWRTDRDIPCVVTKDSEIYVNDRFSQFADIRITDRFTLAGYRDKDHLAVTMLRVDRPEAPPPEPVLTPATAPQEEPENGT